MIAVTIKVRGWKIGDRRIADFTEVRYCDVMPIPGDILYLELTLPDPEGRGILQVKVTERHLGAYAPERIPLVHEAIDQKYRNHVDAEFWEFRAYKYELEKASDKEPSRS